MRRFASAFAVASLLGCSFAFAQTASPGAGGATQTSPPPQPPSSTSEANGAAQTGESHAEHATSGKHMSYKHCSKEAKTKSLTGTERKQFIKDCEAGKSTD